ncbi:ParA family protein, partial [Candidatus Saccharibacteria bacterium]|nr:ParA family protein [Candidatus Saccharibacteria bacterium]
RESKLKNYLVNIQQQYDYIIIDCPPSLGLLFVNALTAASYLIITVQTEFYAMEGLGLLIGTIQNIQKNLNPTLSILGVLMTMYDSRTALSQQVKTEIEKVFTGLVFKTVIPRNVKLAEAPSHGLPINVYDRWSKGSKAYKNFAKEVISRVEA